jgi:hypothetical protein
LCIIGVIQLSNNNFSTDITSFHLYKISLYNIHSSLFFEISDGGSIAFSSYHISKVLIFLSENLLKFIISLLQETQGVLCNTHIKDSLLLKLSKLTSEYKLSFLLNSKVLFSIDNFN